MPEVYGEFVRIGEQLEKHYRDVQDLEFTIERGKLYMLQTRSAKRTAAAAVKIATDLVAEGLITQGGGARADRAGARRPAPARPVRPGGARECDADREGPQRVAGRRGRARGVRRRHRRRVGRSGREGRPRPDRDLAGRLPRHGGRRGDHDRPRRRHAHAAVVARQIGKPCVAGSADLVIEYGTRSAYCARTGDRLRGGRLGQPRWLDRRGLTSVRCRPSSARFEDQPELQTILGWADEVRRMQVWTNADKPEEAAMARRYGAQGIGLCRTEHMFREGERLEIVRGAILVAMVATRAKAKAAAGETADRRGVGGGRDVRCRDGQARDAPAGRLRGHLPGDGRRCRS